MRSGREPQFDFIAGEAAQVDHALVEDQVLALDALQDSADQRLLVEIEGIQPGRVFEHRIADFHRFEAGQDADGEEAETLGEIVDAGLAGLDQAFFLREQIERLGGALEHVAPVGLVGHFLLEQHFEIARLHAAADADDRQRLGRPLVDPAGRHLHGARDSDLEAGGIGEIDDMVAHADALAPVGFAAGALVEMAFFRMDDAGIALRELAEAGVAIALVETLGGLAAAMNAEDAAGPGELHRLANHRVERHPFFGKHHAVGDRVFQAAFHFAHGAAGRGAKCVVL